MEEAMTGRTPAQPRAADTDGGQSPQREMASRDGGDGECRDAAAGLLDAFECEKG